MVDYYTSERNGTPTTGNGNSTGTGTNDGCCEYHFFLEMIKSPDGDCDSIEGGLAEGATNINILKVKCGPSTLSCTAPPEISWRRRKYRVQDCLIERSQFEVKIQNFKKEGDKCKECELKIKKEAGSPFGPIKWDELSTEEQRTVNELWGGNFSNIEFLVVSLINSGEMERDGDCYLPLPSNFRYSPQHDLEVRNLGDLTCVETENGDTNPV